MKFGAFIRQHRVARNIPLKEFASQLGLSSAYFSRIERELENPPKDEVITKAAQILQVNPDDAFVAAGRLPPDMRPHLAEIVRMYRRESSRYI